MGEAAFLEQYDKNHGSCSPPFEHKCIDYSPLIAIDFDMHYGGGAHLLICAMSNFAFKDTMINTKKVVIGNTYRHNTRKQDEKGEGEHIQICDDKDEYICKCMVQYGGSVNTLKGIKFYTNRGRVVSIGRANDEQHWEMVKPPDSLLDSYALCGFYGQAASFIYRIGFIFHSIPTYCDTK
eukprot:89989_1